MAPIETPFDPSEQRLNSTPIDLDETKTWTVGVTVFRLCPTVPKFELLLVKRKAEERAHPSCSELSGGPVEPSEAVGDAVDRNTLEKTGLIVDEVIEEFETVRWESGSGETHVQLNYVVKDKKPVKVTLNSKEHSESMWACKEDIESLLMTQHMEKVVQDALHCSRILAVLEAFRNMKRRVSYSTAERLASTLD